MYANPTPAQIQAAQMAFIAESFYKTIKVHFDQWKREILDSEPYYIDTEYYRDEYKKFNADFPADRLIRDPKYCPYINGWSFTGVLKGSPADRFFSALRIKAIDYGYARGENAEDTARGDWHAKLWAFIDATYSIHYIRRADMSLTLRDQLMTILMDMFAPSIENEALEPLTKQFYNERMMEKKQEKIVFEDNEASFKWFQALKKYIPVLDFLPSIIPNPDQEEKKSVEGIEYILSYMPDCSIYQMKPYGTFSFENFRTTTKQYAFINLSDELIESNDLQEVEQALFDEFLQYFNQ